MPEPVQTPVGEPANPATPATSHGALPPPAVPPPYRYTTWTFRQNLGRALWLSIARPVWRLLPFFRSTLLRLFGANIGRGCRFAGSARIEVPWNLTIGDRVRIGERCILLSLGPISIGAGCTLDYGAHLCAGTHDMNDPTFPLMRTPIAIGAGTFLGVQSFVGPGVSVGARCRILPRACVYRDCPDDSVLQGNPAKPIRPTDERPLPAGDGMGRVSSFP